MIKLDQIIWSASIVLRTRPRASRRANRRTSFERSWDQLIARKRAGLYSFDETIMIACERMAPLHPHAVSPEPTVFSSKATNDPPKDVGVTRPNWVVERPSGRAEKRTATRAQSIVRCWDLGPMQGMAATFSA